MEMALHHFVAFYLYFGYYMSNMWEIGMTIAFLHDIADITTTITKPISNTKYKTLTVFIFLVHMCLWAWTRLYVLPVQMIYEGIYLKCDAFHVDYAKGGFIYLLGCMTTLHAYWFWIFIKMLLHFAFKGQTEDLQNNSRKAKLNKL